MKSLLSLVLLTCLLACGGAGSSEPTLVGTWGFSPEWIQKMGGPGSAEEQAESREISRRITVTFDADGTCRAVDHMESEVTGTYTIKQTAGNVFTVEMVIDGKTVEHVYTVDGDEMSETVGVETVTYVRR